MTDDTDDCPFLGGRLLLRQFKRGHRAGTDACLLAAALDVRPGQCVIDAGAGVGSAALAVLVQRPDATAVLIERDTQTMALAGHNIAANQMQDRARAVEADLFDKVSVANTELANAADVVISNPPFYDADTLRMSPDPRRRLAHVMHGGSHGDWLRAMIRLVKHHGRIVLIHRPEVLPDLLRDWPRGCGEIRIRTIHGQEGEPAIRMLLSAKLGSRAPLAILPSFTLHRRDGSFTAEAEAIHRGESGPLM